MIDVSYDLPAGAAEPERLFLCIVLYLAAIARHLRDWWRMLDNGYSARVTAILESGE